MPAVPRAAGDAGLPGLGLALALALGLALAGAATARAGEGAALSGAPAFEIAEGRASGALDDAPLGAVLEAFARDTGLVYELPEALRARPLSGRFAGEPAGPVLTRLLRGLDYTAVWRADGTVASVTVTGLRSPAAAVGGGEGAGEAAPARDRAVAVESTEEFWAEGTARRALTEEELLEEARFTDLEALAEQAGIPLEHLYLEPAGEDLEPQLNTNLLGILLQGRAAE